MISSLVTDANLDTIFSRVYAHFRSQILFRQAADDGARTVRVVLQSLIKLTLVSFAAVFRVVTERFFKRSVTTLITAAKEIKLTQD